MKALLTHAPSMKALPKEALIENTLKKTASPKRAPSWKAFSKQGAQRKALSNSFPIKHSQKKRPKGALMEATLKKVPSWKALSKRRTDEYPS